VHIALILTSRCTARCTHCSASCSPERTDALLPAHVERLMNEAALIDDGEDLHFDITGGEPFMDFEQLHAAIAHAGKLGGGVSCVTNAFWARTDAIATEKLTRLRDAGLELLSVSVSRFHERYVPLTSVRRALSVAAHLGIETELKGAITRRDLADDGIVAKWEQTLDADQICIFPVIPYLRSDAPPLPDDEYYREPGLPKGRCPSEIITIETNGTASSCCGQSPEPGFLRIGDTNHESLAVIHERFRHARRQRILRRHGPIAFARRAIEAGYGHLLRDAYGGPCDLCIQIGSTPELRRIADEMSAPDGPDMTTTTTNKRRTPVIDMKTVKKNSSGKKKKGKKKKGFKPGMKTVRKNSSKPAGTGA